MKNQVQKVPSVKAHNAKEVMLANRFEQNQLQTKIVNGKTIICNN